MLALCTVLSVTETLPGMVQSLRLNSQITLETFWLLEYQPQFIHQQEFQSYWDKLPLPEPLSHLSFQWSLLPTKHQLLRPAMRRRRALEQRSACWLRYLLLHLQNRCLNCWRVRLSIRFRASIYLLWQKSKSWRLSPANIEGINRVILMNETCRLAEVLAFLELGPRETRRNRVGRCQQPRRFGIAIL